MPKWVLVAVLVLGLGAESCPCSNGGRCVGGTCDCRWASEAVPAWGGASCERHQCLQYENGVATSAAPTNSLGRCPQCSDGRGGFLCRQCASDAGCPAPHPTCHTSFTPIKRKSLTCNLADPYYTHHLGGNGIAHVRCEDIEGVSGDQNGTCLVEFHREQAWCSPNALQVEEFFWCKSTQCTARVEHLRWDGRTPPSHDPCSRGPNGVGEELLAQAAVEGSPRGAGHTPGTVVVAVLHGLSLLLLVFAAAWGGHRGMAVVGVAATLVMAIVAVAVGGSALDSPTSTTRAYVTYSCRSTECHCAPPSANRPVCNASFFGNSILPIIGAMGWALHCLPDTGTCFFEAGSFIIDMTGCLASECAAANGTAPVDSEGSSGDDTALVIVWSVVGTVGAVVIAVAVVISLRLEKNQVGVGAPPDAFGRVGCSNVGYSVAGKTVLAGVSLHGGCAVMGPTGCGKTTLLHILGGRRLEGSRSGRVSTGTVRFFAGADHLPGDLTVSEYLHYVAEMAHCQWKVPEILEAFLINSTATTRIRSLSEGERRRVAMAGVVLPQHGALLMDEPTSNLDASTARTVLQALLRDAPGLIYTVHQPPKAVWDLVTDVAVLSRHGRLLYFGAASEAAPTIRVQYGVEWGEGVPAAEYIAEVAGCAEPGWEVDCSVDVEDTETLGPVVGWAHMTAILLRRSVALTLSNQVLLGCHAAVALASAVLVSLVYEGQELSLPGVLNRSGMFTYLLLLVALSSLSVIDVIVTERPNFLQERAGQLYTTLPYFLSRMFVDFVTLRILPVVAFSFITYFSVRLRTDVYLEFIGVLVLFNLVMTSLAAAVAAVSPSVGAGSLASCALILFFFIFVLQVDGMEDIRWLSPFALAYELLMVRELDHLTCTFTPTDASGDATGVSVRVPCRLYLANLHLDPSRLADDRSALVAWLLGYLFLGCALLQLTQSASHRSGVRDYLRL
eukprot:Sspe_Gene.20461::Locus_7517_Transcript_1_1_Confidence_1.000_Length_2969::g.20461::m.20461/K05681/ABCG2, CD338; ATP-binding cassette, subfamily G (WHITE), member 2